MSISLKEAKNKLDILDKIEYNPKLILTDLFTKNMSTSNFLYQINIDGKYIMDYLFDYLRKIPVFEDCIIEEDVGCFKVSLPTLSLEDKYKCFVSNDLIVRINPHNKTYMLLNERIQYYEDIMKKEYVYEEKKLSDFWRSVLDLRFGARLKQVSKCLKSNKQFWTKVNDCLFWLFMSNKTKKRIAKELKKQQEIIESDNTYRKKENERKLERQAIVRNIGSNHIKMIKNKQLDIETFLKEIGYTQKNS